MWIDLLAGVWYVIAAKRYYRCPVCEKVVVPTKRRRTPQRDQFWHRLQTPKCVLLRGSAELVGVVQTHLTIPGERHMLLKQNWRPEGRLLFLWSVPDGLDR